MELSAVKKKLCKTYRTPHFAQYEFLRFAQSKPEKIEILQV